MIKSLVSANKSEREKFTIPRSVQETLPVKCVYPDGIWLVGSRHSKSWQLTDVNYAAASDEERRGIFVKKKTTGYARGTKRQWLCGEKTRRKACKESNMVE